MATTKTNKITEFPLFDWLRIAMALLVAASHFSLIAWQHAGNLGVQVFFALSGWLIGSILIEMKADKLPLFYFNRATRVWIPYFIAVTALYALSAFRDPVNSRWFEFLTYDVTFTHNLFTLVPDAKVALAQMPLQGTGNHFWSLAVEEQFYLAAPLIILTFRYGRHPVTWLWIAVAMLFIRQEFSAIAFGVTAAALHHIRPGFQHHRLIQTAFVVIIVAAGAALFSSAYPFAVPFFAIAVVLLCAVPGNRSSIGRFVGGVSYPLYLNHWIALVGISAWRSASAAIRRCGRVSACS